MGCSRKEFPLVTAKIQYGSARKLNAVPTRIRRQVRVADPNRFPVEVHATRSVALLFGAALLIGGVLTAVPKEIPGMAIATVLGGAWLSLVLAMTLPGRAERAGAELARRLGQFRHAVNAVGDEPTRDTLEALLRYARMLELRDDEIAGELATLRAAIDGVELTARLERGDLPVVHAVGMAPGDECHFSAPVRFGRRRADQFGHLLLTSGWLKFRGSFDLSVAWSEVARIERAGLELIAQLHDSRRMHRFALQTEAEAIQGGVLAQHLMRAAHDEGPRTQASGPDSPETWDLRPEASSF
jgi:hypothetical protein